MRVYKQMKLTCTIHILLNRNFESLTNMKCNLSIIIVSLLLLVFGECTYVGNLIQNGGMENATSDEWTPHTALIYSNGGSFSINSTSMPIPAYEGTKAACVVGVTRAAMTWDFAHPPMDGEIILSMMINKNNVGGINNNATVAAYNNYYGTGVWVNGTNATIHVGPTNGWIKITLNLTNLVLYEFNTMYIFMLSYDPTGYVMVDNVSVIYTGPSDPINPSPTPSITPASTPSTSVSATPSSSPLHVYSKEKSVLVGAVVSSVVGVILIVIVVGGLVIFRSRLIRRIMGTESDDDIEPDDVIDEQVLRDIEMLKKNEGRSGNGKYGVSNDPVYNTGNVDGGQYNNIVPDNSNYNNISGQDNNRLGTGQSNYNN